MPNIPFTALNQPGLLGIKPVITHDASVEEIDNTELRKIAKDIFDALKYSISFVVANPDKPIRDNTIEADFKTAFNEFKEDVQDIAIAQAKAIFSSDKAGLGMVFGRYAKAPQDSFIGFDRLIEGMEPLKLDFKRLGFPTSDKVEVPINLIKKTDDGLLIPKNAIPELYKDSEEIKRELYENSKAVIEEKILDIDRLSSALDFTYYNRDPFEVGGANEDFEAQAVTDKVRIWVRSVKCIDETNPEWPGDDEIALAGISIDEDGDIKKIGEQKVGNGFRDGRLKTLNWNYHWFSLSERPYWPKKFGVTFVLAEKDNGGLSKFIQDLWSKIKEQVQIVISAAAAAAGVAIGVFLGLPDIGGIIGSILGSVVNWVINNLVNWLANIFKDDIFRPKTAWINIPSMSARWYYPNGKYGSTLHPVQSFRFTGHGGQYDLMYQWELF